jgi:hypothetical protein
MAQSLTSLASPRISRGNHCQFSNSRSQSSPAGPDYSPFTTCSTGHPIPGFSLAEADELFGDSVDQTASWKNATDLNHLVGQEVRLRFVLHDGDLFSFQFRD